MGQIIKLNTWGEELPGALTQAGRGGFLSRGYLAERPAISLIDDGETIQYVLTNRRRGVRVTAADSTYNIKPDGRHRTVVVITDRRLLVLVGREDGDERSDIDLGDIVGVETSTGRRNGRLTVESTDETWAIPTDTDGLDDVVSYLRDAASAWRAVEDLLETVESELATAARQLADGEHDAALATALATEDPLETATSKAIDFSTEYPGNALHGQPDPVEALRRETIGAVRAARARHAAAKADEWFSDGDYEMARKAYERAREEYDAALRVEADAPDGIRSERRQVDAIVTRIRESPLRKAITADRAAVAADEPAAAVDDWEHALSQYRAALAAAKSDSTRRDEPEIPDLFQCAPARIRERIATVARSLAAAHRALAEESMRAGDWYTDAEQYEAALEEYASAAEAFDAALSTAAENYPEAVPHLQADNEALQGRIERARAALTGQSTGPDRIESDDEPTYDLSVTLGDVDGPTAIEDSLEAPRAERTSQGQFPSSTADRLRKLDRPDLTRVVGDALGATDWTTREASPRMPFDMLATRGEERVGVVVHHGDDFVTPDTVAECAAVAGAAGTETVLLATVAEHTAAVERRASESGVRLLCRDSLAAIVDTEGLRLPASAK